MNTVILSLIVVFCALQSVSKKAFDGKANGGGTYLFSAISAFAGMIFFVCTSKEFSFNSEFIPYSIGFGVSFFASMVFSYLAITNGPASISSLVSSYALILPAIYGLVFLKESVGKFFYLGILFLMVSVFLIKKKSQGDSVKISPKWGVYVVVSFFW